MKERFKEEILIIHFFFRAKAAGDAASLLFIVIDRFNVLGLLLHHSSLIKFPTEKN